MDLMSSSIWMILCYSWRSANLTLCNLNLTCLTHGHNTERSCTVFHLVRFKSTSLQFPIWIFNHYITSTGPNQLETHWSYPTHHLLNIAQLNTGSISHYKILQEVLAGWHLGTEPVKRTGGGQEWKSDLETPHCPHSILRTIKVERD